MAVLVAVGGAMIATAGEPWLPAVAEIPAGAFVADTRHRDPDMDRTTWASYSFVHWSR
ncbi:hypothetical protein [Aromatoleum bremense]|uniref:Uncharacterized protein n=1 Tax=Aromatoleum bremense TaxID=76115 RepID=A0ABX1NWV0_9RHOO|nr:hypothetical protein [Aromatoleum bremense]NMG16111.1 hypothetical protein [Aromatoleum bremense]QTQ30197.1 Uncharacterized protein pbN1_02050 [Aromatoleum bremense]